MATVSMAMPLTFAAQKGVRVLGQPSSDALFKLSRAKPESRRAGRVRVHASLKEKAVTGLTAAALTASMMIPDVAEAAESGVLPPSLKNFLLSIAAGGIVLTAIIGAVVGVSNFDPVNRT